MTYAAAASEPVQTNLLYHLRDIRKTRAGADGFSLHIAGLDVWPGEKVALVGPSGMGKSTALDLLSLSLRPDSPDGEVPGDCFVFSPGGLSYDIGRLWNSGDDESLAPLRLRYLGYVLQTGGLLPFLSTMDNIQVLREAKGLPRLLEADRIFSQMGIAHLLKKMPSTLSVGERQRVAVARAVAAEPAVILAD